MNELSDWKHELEQLLSTNNATVGICFYDLDRHKGFSLNGQQKILSASMIKLVILTELMFRVSKQEISLSDSICIKHSMKTGGDGILKELQNEHSFSLLEIATLMIIVSDNEATNILIDLFGMDAINKRASAMNLTQTSLNRKMMDSEAVKKGMDNYTCADDIASIFHKIYEGTLINRQFSNIMLELLQRQQQGERLQRYLPEDIKIAHKCGDLNHIEHDGGILFLPNTTYILVVLKSGVSSALEGKRLIGKISHFFYQKMEELL